MSKAEDLAKNLYPLLETDKIGNNPYITYNIEQLAKQEGFVAGYHQAEEDLELTWADMECIIKHYQDIMDEKSRVFVRVEDYQELLKRFKERK